jgi:IS1 family transposase
VCRETRRILDWEVGGRGLKTLKKLWKRLQLFKVEVYCAEHGIARFKRRGKVVSRSLKDLMPAVAIYFHQVNLKYS